MGQQSTIEWTDATWNPIRGCSRVSEGCRNCYAEKVAYRFSGAGQPYEGLVRVNAHGERQPQWNGHVQFVEKHLLDPLRWKEPRRIFVNSMSDLFHENVHDEWIDKIFAVMALAPQHTFQILTKRPDRMRDYLANDDLAGELMDVMIDMADWNHSPKETVAAIDRALRSVGTKEYIGEHPYTGRETYTYMPKIDAWPLPNVWLGVSVENQATADERIPLLLQAPAAVRFISAEPLLGPVDIGPWLGTDIDPSDDNREYPGLDWVIVGGESGPARPMHPDWVRSLRDQCAAAGVAFFFKQWGEWQPESPGEALLTTARHVWIAEDGQQHVGYNGRGDVRTWRVGKHDAGARIDGVEWREFPGAQHA